MSAKRTYAEVVSGIENTPDYDQSWMQAYQKEREEDALLKAMELSKVKSLSCFFLFQLHDTGLLKT